MFKLLILQYVSKIKIIYNFEVVIIIEISPF